METHLRVRGVNAMNEELLRLGALAAALAHAEPLPAWRADEWETLAPRADAHRLSGYFFSRLQRHPARAHIPPRVLQQWRAYYMRQWANNTRLFAALRRLSKTFADTLLFFKGPLLAYRLYGALDARAISDLDVLLRDRNAFRETDAQLRALGYRRVSRVLIAPRVSQQFTSHFEYRGTDASLELHWNLQQHPALRIDTHALWARRERVTVERETFATLALQDELFAALLAVPVDAQLNKLTVRALFEIYLLSRKLGDAFAWDEWFAERQRDASYRLAVTALDAVARLFGAARVPQKWKAFLAHAPASNPVLTSFARLSAWERRRTALALYEYPLVAAGAWWALSLGGRMLAHPTETARTWQRFKTT
jgi:hypothetical protein